MDKEINSALWRFIRRDTSVSAFEAWVYVHEAALSTALGPEFHFRLLEMNYADRNQVEDMREQLEAQLRPALTCECLAVADEDFILRGEGHREKRFFASVEQLAKYGNEAWWLWLGKCRVCHTHWLIAQPEHSYDDYCVDRVSLGLAEPVYKWPEKYRVYEAVFCSSEMHHKPYRFADRLSKSLVWTVAELRRDWPEISETEMAKRLGCDILHIRQLFKETNRYQKGYLVAIFNKWFA